MQGFDEMGAPWVQVHGHSVVLQLVRHNLDARRVELLALPALAAHEAQTHQGHRAVAVALAYTRVLPPSTFPVGSRCSAY